MGRRLAALIIKILGTPPPRTAPPEVKRLYTRRLYLRLLPPQIIIYGLLVILGAPTWWLIVLALGAVAWLCGFSVLGLQLRSERRRRAHSTHRISESYKLGLRPTSFAKAAVEKLLHLFEG